MRNSGIKCEIGITYESVERLNTYLEKSVNGADQLHIVAGVHDKQATTFSGKVYNKDNTPMITNVHYPIEFDTDKVALIDLRVNKMYTDEFGHNFIRCRSLTEESLRKIVSAMQREVFGITEMENTTEKVKNSEVGKDSGCNNTKCTVRGELVPLNNDIMKRCKSDAERKLFEKLQPVKIVIPDCGKGLKYEINDDTLRLVTRAVTDGISKESRIAKRLGISQSTLHNRRVELLIDDCKKCVM